MLAVVLLGVSLPRDDDVVVVVDDFAR